MTFWRAGDRARTLSLQRYGVLKKPGTVHLVADGSRERRSSVGCLKPSFQGAGLVAQNAS